ncbi:MAG: type II toxin-antitoxin system VapC family toxin [Chromatiales bacterium]|nr:type II toxin-antitoxin system VapC family toxin [Gammaproteobacteria bacterium]MBW6476187.1 type II toxin-antitoxin system VapC family toxin [Chromatiales bacterium]
MILLDTNVLSEFMRPRPEARVVQWLDGQRADTLHTSAVSQAEIELGLALMPDGKRQLELASSAKAMFEEDFAGRCLPFDAIAASHYAHLVAARSRMGRPISVEDAQIAAIALASDMALATRNTRDFESITGLALINPWRSI